MRVTRIGLMTAVKMLRRAYPAGADKYGTAEDHTRTLEFVFEDELVDDSDVSEAVRLMVKSGRSFMPNPGQVLQAAKEHRAHTGGFSTDPTTVRARWRRWMQDQGSGPCPVCGATLRLLEPREQIQGEHFKEKVQLPHRSRVGVLHILDAHDAAGVPPTGYWLPPREVMQIPPKTTEAA